MASLRYVFDAEPLVAFFLGERGADVAKKYLEKVRDGDAEGWANLVNLVEVRYTLAREPKFDVEKAFAVLRESRVQPASADEVWKEAAGIKAVHATGLGDTFALATAMVKKATLIGASDDDLDVAPKLGIKLERIR